MELVSSDFDHFGQIPQEFSCRGESINPPLSISDVPSRTEALVLMLTDPDAPSGEFLHWLVWNIDPGIVEIKRGSIPSGGIEGINDSGQIGYSAPCPPSGTHRYYFQLFALDKILELRPDASKENVFKAMSDHVISTTELVGLYGKS